MRPLRMSGRRKGEAFPTLGTIRKGAPKPQAINGNTGKVITTRPGQDLTYFRFADYDEKNPALINFLRSFGSEPNHLPILFPYSKRESILRIWNEAYKGGVMIHRCTADEDAHVLSALDPNTFRRIVANGVSVDTGEVIKCTGKPLYLDSKQRPIVCSPKLRMSVMLRGQGALATWTVLSGSSYDSELLSLQMEMFESILMTLPHFLQYGFFGIPFILHRSPKELHYYAETGERKTTIKSMLWLELDPEFSARFVDRAARSQLAALDEQLPLLASGNESDDDDDPFMDMAALADDEQPQKKLASANRPQQKAIAAPEQEPDPFMQEEPVELSPVTENASGDAAVVLPLPASGQEFYDWSMKQGLWETRAGEKYTPAEVNKNLGMTVVQWVMQNPGQGYQGAAKTVQYLLGGSGG